MRDRLDAATDIAGGPLVPEERAVDAVAERIDRGPGLGFLGRGTPSLAGLQLRLLGRDAAATVAGVLTALAISATPVPLVLIAVAVAAGCWIHLSSLALPAYEREGSWAPIRSLLALGGCAALSGFVFELDTSSTIRSAMLVVAAVAFVGWVSTLPARLRPGHSSALIVGDRMSVYHLVNQWKNRSEINLVGICLAESPHDSPSDVAEILGIPVVGHLNDAAALAVAGQVARVVVAPGPALTAYDVRRLSWALEDTTIELSVATEIHGALPHRVEPRLLGRRLVLSVRPSKRTSMDTALKSVVDRTTGLLLLVLFAPLLTLLLLAVRLDSPGPGVFRQQRVGKDGQVFDIYKLRTMGIDAEARREELAALNEGAGPLFKMRADPRVTRVGRLLRMTSLDELPQLINVVRGEMSLIGPRPALPEEIAHYDDWIRRRLSVKPGMTGLWQVNGRSDLAWEEGVRLDLDYVDNWTTVRDFGIAARTVKAVIRREGAH